MNSRMIQEGELIPYHASPLPDGPWLVFSPHPDDETIGMGGSLLLAARQGIEVVLVVLTDGALGGGAGNGKELVRIREEEAREAARLLHVRDIQFWRQKDRELRVTPELVCRIADLVRQVRPASVFFPSPMELHPDHRAAAELAWQGLESCPEFRGNAYSYEISGQSLANRLVDITAVVDEKAAVMRVYRSQLAENDYVEVALALNRARSYTLPPEVGYAEASFAYDRVAGTDLAVHLVERLRPYWKRPAGFETPLVTVITRTKDRPQMLKKALQSVAEQSYPNIEMIVVNDGGMDVAGIVQGFEGLVSRAGYIALKPAKGRSAAANAGLEQSTGKYIIFLDDDDWLLPNHLTKLVEVLEKDETSGVAYTAVECLREEAPGEWNRLRIFDEPFDPVRLMIQNYIPLHAALFRRDFVDFGCRFDEGLTIYEDWDFWVQLSQRTTFRHVEGISAVYRIGGTGGFGVAGDDFLAHEAYRDFLEKWRHLWSAQQLAFIIEYARREVDLRLTKAELEVTKTQTRALEIELHETRGRLDDAKGAVERIKGERESLRRALEEVRDERDDLQRAVEATTRERDEIRRALEEVRGEQDSLRRERGELQQAKEHLALTLGDQLDKVRTEVIHWSERCRAIENSCTWRFTKPLRAVSTAVKALLFRPDPKNRS
jgi:LmbE family N-acetylglucosaminyl deacetylase/glycosyltransferase involved in cell wall biosynthesis